MMVTLCAATGSLAGARSAPEGGSHYTETDKRSLRPPPTQTPHGTGLEPLNVRERAGVSAAIVGTLQPLTTGINLTGRQQIAADGGTWWEIRHPDLPDGRGWVEARFLGRLETPDGPPPVQHTMGPTPADLAERFTEVEGYQTQDRTEVALALHDVLVSDASSPFLPDSHIGPLAKSILLLEANEGILPRVRYRIRYRMTPLPPPPADRSMPTSFVQVDRFNLGPALRERTAARIGTERTGSAERFGVGPHVSYRFAMLPTTGQVADVIAAARAEIPEAFAEAMGCLGVPCLSLDSTAALTVDWGNEVERELDFIPAYERSRDGVFSPVAAMDLVGRELEAAFVSDDDRLFFWRGFEAREGPSLLRPYFEVIIDVNLGPDGVVDAVAKNQHFMDDEILAVWQRIKTFSGGTSEPPIFGARMVERRHGIQFSPR